MQANGIELEYDSEGEGDPLVLIMGIGAQMIVWPEGFRQMLVERGYRVIRFDNRDVGLSTKTNGVRPGDIRRLMMRGLLGLPVTAPYTLSDMADDVVGLMDGLGIDSAHIVGASMGGMIGQTLAIVHPSRIRSLTSIMSTAGRRRDSFGKLSAIRALTGPAPRNREQAIERAIGFYHVCGSPGFPTDWDKVRETAGLAYDRCFYPRGFVRQMAAVLATGSRYHALKFVRTPTAVIHGTRDPLIRPAAGRATARAIPGATLRMIDGMGHDLPEAVWPVVVDEIVGLRARTS